MKVLTPSVQTIYFKRPLAIGHWLLAVGHWLLAIGGWLLARVLADLPLGFAAFSRRV